MCPIPVSAGQGLESTDRIIAKGHCSSVLL